MLLRSRRTFAKRHHVFTDLREAEKSVIYVNPIVEPVSYIVENLPAWCNKEYRRGDDMFNPFTMICTCEEYKESTKEFAPLDFRRVCRHLYNFYMYRIKNDINPLAVILMEQNKKYGSEELIQAELNGTIFYYGFTRTNEWVNIYCNENMWIRFSYNIRQKRWSDKIAPGNGDEYVKLLKKYFSL
jgi:hypothetical protein